MILLLAFTLLIVIIVSYRMWGSTRDYTKRVADYKIKNSQEDQPKTGFGTWMVYRVIPRWENNVLGLVYYFAGFLIIIIGLRSIGTSLQDVPILNMLADPKDGKLQIGWIVGALIFECVMVVILATVMFFKQEETDDKITIAENITLDQAIARIKKAKEESDDLTNLLSKL